VVGRGHQQPPVPWPRAGDRLALDSIFAGGARALLEFYPSFRNADLYKEIAS
jgi:hypothetical protein